MALPAGLQGLYRRRRRGCTVRDPAAGAYSDLVKRRFAVDAPDRLRLTEIYTEHGTEEGSCTALR